MIYDLQKAGIWKRMAAWIFDGILTCILAVGLGLVLSALLGYNQWNQQLNEAYGEYEAEYGIRLEISQETYEAMSDEERASYDAAYEALISDEETVYIYNMVLNLSLVITTLGILLAVMVWEFAIPLLFGNGQTLGKKIFGLGVIRNDGVQINNLQLFTRTLLGKYTIDTMIPVAIVMMLLWGITDLSGTLVLLALLAGQLLCLGLTRTNSAIHDLLAGTVVVDISSQMIFRTTEDLIAYQKKVAAERASRQPY